MLYFNGVAQTTVIYNGSEVYTVYFNGTVYYAKIAVSFDSNGGSAVSDTIVYYGSTYGTLPVSSRTGYSFDGWTLTDGGVNYVEASTTVTITSTTLTLYAHWTIIEYTITWKSYAGATLQTDIAHYGDTVYGPANTAMTTQYEYYWPNASFNVTGNETVNELRAVRTYTITWKSYSGATLKTETIPYGSTSTAPTGTTDTAQYDYSWPKASTVCSGTETITETRTTKTYTITWYYYSGGVAKTETVAYGTQSNAPTGTSDTAQYDYSWPTSYEIVTQDMSVNETRALRSYTITWKSYGLVTLKTETLTYGSTSYAPTGTADNAMYDYYWPKTSTTVVGTETINELRQLQTYTVTFNANGGTTPSPTSKTVTYGSTYGTLATTSRTGYTFNGWFTATSGGTQITSSTTVSLSANQTLYAQWTSNTTTAPEVTFVNYYQS